MAPALRDRRRPGRDGLDPGPGGRRQGRQGRPLRLRHARRRPSRQPLPARSAPDRGLSAVAGARPPPQRLPHQRRSSSQGPALWRLGVRGHLGRHQLPRPHPGPLPVGLRPDVPLDRRRALQAAGGLCRRRAGRLPGRLELGPGLRLPEGPRPGRGSHPRREDHRRALVHAAQGVRRSARRLAPGGQRDQPRGVAAPRRLDGQRDRAPVGRPVRNHAGHRARRHERGLRRSLRPDRRHALSHRRRALLAQGPADAAVPGSRHPGRPARQHPDPKDHRLPARPRGHRPGPLWRRRAVLLADGHADTLVRHRRDGRRRALLPEGRFRETRLLGQGLGDLLPAQHAETDPRPVRSGPAGRVRRLLRARALQRHPGLAGPRQRHGHLLPRRAGRAT